MKCFDGRKTAATMTRRTALLVAAGMAAFLLGAPAQAAEPDFTGVTLRVATWGGDWRDILAANAGAEFEKHGGKIEWVLGSPPENLAKLIASKGTPPFDVMEMTDAVVKQMIDGGFLEKIDLSKIPNTAQLNPDQFDDQKVASWTTQEAIVYNKAKFEELGIPAPTKYSDLANPKLAGHVSLPDISSGGGVSALAGFNFEAGGNESDPTPGLEAMKQVDVINYWKNGDDVLTQMKTGDVWAAAINVSYAKLGVEAGLPLAVTHVQIGDKRGMKKAGYLGIIKGTQVADAAAFYINAYIDEQNQYEIHVKSGELPVNHAAQAKVIEYYKDKPEIASLFLLSPEDSAKLNHPDTTKLDLADWSEKWNRMAASH